MEYPGGLKEWFSESTDRELFEDVPSEEEDDDDELKPDKKLKENEEIIVYDGIEYIHNIKDDEILTMDDMEPVGVYDGDNIEWNSFDEYNEHLKRKGEDPEEDEDEGDEDEGDEDEGDEGDEDEGGEDEGDEGEEGADKDDDKDDKDDDKDDDDGEEDDKDDEEDKKGKLPRHVEEDSSEEESDDEEDLPKDKKYFESKTVKELIKVLDSIGKQDKIKQNNPKMCVQCIDVK